MPDRKEAAPARPHALSLDQRKRAIVSGVETVDSFNEQRIALLTSAGAMTICGEGLHVSRLNLDEGQLVIEGQIIALQYDERARGAKGGAMKRLLR